MVPKIRVAVFKADDEVCPTILPQKPGWVICLNRSVLGIVSLDFVFFKSQAKISDSWNETPKDLNSCLMLSIKGS